MASTIEHVKIAANHNNAAGLKALYELSPPLFADYYIIPGSVFTEWFGAEAYERAGDRTLRKIGRPYVIWTLPASITRDEYDLLRSTFCSTHLTGEVTIRTLNKDLNAWGNYNALMQMPQNDSRKWEDNEWLDVKLFFYDLVAL